MPKRNRKPRTPTQKAARRAKEKSRWKLWKRHQRARKLHGKNRVRHHSGGRVTVMSRKSHARKHKADGTAGGRPKKR